MRQSRASRVYFQPFFGLLNEMTQSFGISEEYNKTTIYLSFVEMMDI